MWRIRHTEETRSVFEVGSEQLHAFKHNRIIKMQKNNSQGTDRVLVCAPSSRQLKKYKVFVLPGINRATFLCCRQFLFVIFCRC